MSATTVLTSVFAHGGRTGRYGEFTIVYMHGCTFITTPMEFMQQQNWARARVSTGNASRDRTSFIDRFETVVGRSGGGVATRGNRSVLSRIVKAMKASSVTLEEWMIPRDLDAGMEMKRPKGWISPAVARAAAAAAAVAAAPAVLVASAVVAIEAALPLPAVNDPVPVVVVPLPRK
jgi:hypothetical protein